MLKLRYSLLDDLISSNLRGLIDKHFVPPRINSIIVKSYDSHVSRSSMVSHLAVMKSEWNIHENCECAIYIFQFQVIHDSQWTSKDTLSPTVRLFSAKSFVKTSVTGLAQALQSNSMRLTGPQAASLQLGTRQRCETSCRRTLYVWHPLFARQQVARKEQSSTFRNVA